MAHPDEVAHFKDDTFEMVVDARHFPLLITRSRGEPTIPVFDQSIVWRNAWLDHAKNNGTKCYLIANVAEVRPPNAIVRKHMADAVADDLSNPGFLGTGTIVTSALLRGVVTAITWVAGKDRSGFGDCSSSIGDGIKVAFEAYDRAGLKRPDIDPSKYEMLKFPGE